jgi:hypothetical protein
MTEPRVEVLPIEQAATPDQNNINRHTQRGQKLVENSLRRRGAFRSIASAGKGVEVPVIYAGNLTLETAVAAGFKEIVNVHVRGDQLVNVVRDDVEPGSAEAIALGLEDNESGKQSYNPDIDLLAQMAAGDDAILAKLREEDKTFSQMLENMGVKDESQDAEPQIDRVAELLEKWGVVTGDLWQIGEQFLLCGDCTNRVDVERVMQGDKANLVLTDPPYGLDEKKKSGKNSYDDYKDTKENLIALAQKWLPLALELSPVVVFSPGVTNAWVYPPANWVMSWFYGGGQLRSPWGFNCWQPLLCYGKDPSLAAGQGGRPDAVEMNVPANEQDIDHPCPKPLKLWDWLINRLSFGNADILYEPFAGSGTTLVACQNLGRKCRAIEISPAYCAVILERMATAFPDLKIERI